MRIVVELHFRFCWVVRHSLELFSLEPKSKTLYVDEDEEEADMPYRIAGRMFYTQEGSKLVVELAK